jgi:hypothetical protein
MGDPREVLDTFFGLTFPELSRYTEAGTVNYLALLAYRPHSHRPRPVSRALHCVTSE